MEDVVIPNEILNTLRNRLIASLSSRENPSDVFDGMDSALTTIDTY